MTELLESAVNVERQRGVTVVSIARDANLEFVIDRSVVDNLLDVVTRNSVERLVIDFDYAEWATSPVVSGLLDLRERLPQDTELKVCGVSESARYACRFLNLDQSIFHMFETVEAAIASYE